MSEGDAVHRTARRLNEALAGVPLLDARSPNPRAGLQAAATRLRGASLSEAEARGKHLLLHFDNGLALHSHLGMNGSWRVSERGGLFGRPERSAWLVLVSECSQAAQFGGPRLVLRREAQLALDPLLGALGPDVLAPDFVPAHALQRLRAADPARQLGEALLDQTLVSGIGNIYKSEASFEARLEPWRRLGELSDDELSSVLHEARRLMTAGLERGRMPRSIYRRAGQPCPRCGTRIKSRGQGDANRTTYWCPGCQG